MQAVKKVSSSGIYEALSSNLVKPRVMSLSSMVKNQHAPLACTGHFCGIYVNCYRWLGVTCHCIPCDVRVARQE